MPIKGYAQVYASAVRRGEDVSGLPVPKEYVMAEKYITIGKQDHLGDGTPDNLTACGKDIPYASTWGYTEREGTTNPCPKCFPETRKATKAK